MRYVTLIVLAMAFACTPAWAQEEMPVLKYGDGQADGKKSFGGSGMMIEFTIPPDAKVAGLRIHGSRYGLPEAPDEKFLIYFLSQDQKRILHTEMAPYSLFQRSQQEWVTVSFKKPIELPEHFWIVLNFRAHRTKGVFVSYDTSTKGQHSRVGLPGMRSRETEFNGDWMVQAVLDKQ